MFIAVCYLLLVYVTDQRLLRYKALFYWSSYPMLKKVIRC